MNKIVETIIFGNTVLAYTQALGIFLIATILFGILQYLVLAYIARIAQKTKTTLDDVAIKIVRSIRPGFYIFVALFFSYQFLQFPKIVDTIFGGILIVWIAYQVVVALQILIDYIIDTWKGGEDVGTLAAYRFLGNLIKILLWAFAVLFILSNFGVDITTLIAGLGIGGVAIAFALQKILADLFSSFAIYFDKPFVVGDTIQVGAITGTVEKIGIKTTRIRSLRGEEIVFSNQELTSTPIQNYKRMQERRMQLQFGITYETPITKIENVPTMVQKIFDNIPSARLDRVHFTTLGDSALIFEVTYYILSPEYKVGLDAQQEILLALMKAFEKEGITFAYPTQTLYIEKTTK